MIAQESAVTVFLMVTGILVGNSHGGVVPTENACEGGTLYEVRISDCNGFPCKMRRGKDYSVEIDFTPSRDTGALTIRCDTVLYGKAYAIPEQSICNDLSPEKCPLNNITRYTYKVNFNIPYFVPPGHYPIRCWVQDDQKADQLCLTGNGNIV